MIVPKDSFKVSIVANLKDYVNASRVVIAEGVYEFYDERMLQSLEKLNFSFDEVKVKWVVKIIDFDT